MSLIIFINLLKLTDLIFDDSFLLQFTLIMFIIYLY